MTKVLEPPIETSPKINYSIIKQIIKDRKHPLDMVREAISNMGDQDVGAKNCDIEYYKDPTYGSSFIFRDDGCGMRYSGDENNPEGLDKFIHFGFSKTSGFKSGKLGEKGLGAKLILDSKKVEIRTWTGINTDKVYYVEINDPRSKVFKTPTEPPKVYITPRDPDTSDKKGTEIKVYGYSNPEREYSKKEIEEYLYYRTLVGYTKEDKDKLPKFVLNYMGKREELEPGFPYITKLYDDEGNQKWDTIITDPTIQVIQNIKSDTEVKVILKGGLTIEPGQFNLNDRTGGLFLSVYGIPYFDIDFNKYKGEFQQYKRFCRFVVECDVLGDKEKLNINRGNFDEEDEIVKFFKLATKKAFNLLANRPEYIDFLKKYSKREEKEKSLVLNERKMKLNESSQKYVYYKGKFLHRLPNNEHDTLALFWKLEGMGVLPFEFHSLEHTNQSGVDVIANYQEEEISEKKLFVAVEFEPYFERYVEQDHNPHQTSLIVCWEIKNPDKLEKLKDYKYRVTIQGVSIDILEIKSFPGIEIKKGLQK